MRQQKWYTGQHNNIIYDFILLPINYKALEAVLGQQQTLKQPLMDPM